MSKISRRDIKDCFLIVAIGIAVGFIIYTNLFRYSMNADIASEAVLAQLIWNSGEWIPKSWYPSTELRIWTTPNLAALFYGITSDMSMAMGGACIMMTLGILASAYFFISQFSFNRTQKLFFLLLCLIFPNNFHILELLYVFASYYAIHIILLFFTLGIYARLINGKDISCRWLVIAVIFSFMMGMQGVRGILILSGPLLVTEVLRESYLIYSRQQWKNKKTLIIGGWCFSLLLAGYAGTLLPFSIGNSSTSRNIRKSFVKLINTIIPDIKRCLGWGGLSLTGRFLYTGLLLITLAVLVLFIVKLVKKQYIDAVMWIYLVLWISVAATIFIIMFTTIDSSHRYYFIIYFAMAFGLTYLIKNICEKTAILRAIGYTIPLILFLYQTNTVYISHIRSEQSTMPELSAVCRYLEDNGYYTAYASFERANIITVLSNGSVKCAAVASVERMDINKWLSSTDWYVPNVPYETKTAYIITESEKEAFSVFYEQHREELQFMTQIDKYLIYVSNYNYSYL